MGGNIKPLALVSFSLLKLHKFDPKKANRAKSYILNECILIYLNAENYRLSEGDILFARTGASVGKSYIYRSFDGLVYYAGFLIRARIKSEYNPEFVFQNTLTSDYEKFIKVTSMRSGQPGVNAQEYSQFEVMVPSRAEQDKISECLRNIDNFITLQQRKCNEGI